MLIVQTRSCSARTSPFSWSLPRQLEATEGVGERVLNLVCFSSYYIVKNWFYKKYKWRKVNRDFLVAPIHSYKIPSYATAFDVHRLRVRSIHRNREPRWTSYQPVSGHLITAVILINEMDVHTHILLIDEQPSTRDRWWSSRVVFNLFIFQWNIWIQVILGGWNFVRCSVYCLFAKKSTVLMRFAI